MSDQCKHCTVRGDWDKCQSTECFHHENWAWLQLKDQRDKLQARVEELEKVLVRAYVRHDMGGEVDWHPSDYGIKDQSK